MPDPKNCDSKVKSCAPVNSGCLLRLIQARFSQLCIETLPSRGQRQKSGSYSRTHTHMHTWSHSHRRSLARRGRRVCHALTKTMKVHRATHQMQGTVILPLSILLQSVMFDESTDLKPNRGRKVCSFALKVPSALFFPFHFCLHYIHTYICFKSLPEVWEPEGSAQYLSCSYDCALLHRDLRCSSWALQEPLAQLILFMQHSNSALFLSLSHRCLLAPVAHFSSGSPDTDIVNPGMSEVGLVSMGLVQPRNLTSYRCPSRDSNLRLLFQFIFFLPDRPGKPILDGRESSGHFAHTVSLLPGQQFTHKQATYL